MTVNIEKNNNDILVQVEGRLDTTTAPTLDTTLAEEVSADANLVLDMKGLEYISSAGLRVLLSAQKRMKTAGTMKLVNVCEEVMEVFEMTGFADILVIE